MKATNVPLILTFCLTIAVLGAQLACGPNGGGGTNTNTNTNTNNNDNGTGTIDPNAEICETRDRCCEGDGFCDTELCVAEDLDCAGCGADGVCVIDCTTLDPDCTNEEICERSEFCCPDDGNCDVDQCNTAETDTDCTACAADGVCVIGCIPTDSDCTNAEICTSTEFCCDDDEICDTDECPDSDADCSSCGADGVCVALCLPLDPDCTTNDDICSRSGFCCPDDPFCDEDECPELDPDCQ